MKKQVTDHDYKIGQWKNILVHKLICHCTSEEKINEMIIQKKDLASGILQEGKNSFLTELDNNEFLKILSLNSYREFDNQ